MTESVQASRSTRPDVSFPPVPNGIDYLISVVDHLATHGSGSPDPKPRDLKYAVLHLQAAAEVLLKARLLHEHWALVFKDPGKADHARYLAGDFETCGVAETITRLGGIVGIDLSQHRGKLTSLAKSRNALQHFGLTDSAFAVEARTADVLDFLLEFIQAELLPTLDAAEASAVAVDLERLLAAAAEIRSFVKTRMDRLRPELEPVRSMTTQCPACGKWSLVVDGEDNTCRFCQTSWGTSEITEAYVSEVLGLSWYDVGHDGAEEPTASCPRECGATWCLPRSWRMRPTYPSACALPAALFLL